MGRGWRRGGHVERALLRTCPPQPFSDSVPPVNPLVLPPVPQREKGNKTEDPEDGVQGKREQLCRGTRRGARGRQHGGALGRKGAFVRLVAGTSGTSLRGGGWGRGPSLVPEPAESALRGSWRRVRGVGAWEGGLRSDRKALVESTGGSGLYFGLGTRKICVSCARGLGKGCTEEMCVSVFQCIPIYF